MANEGRCRSRSPYYGWRCDRKKRHTGPHKADFIAGKKMWAAWKSA